MTDSSQLKAVAARLRQLQISSPTSVHGLEEWYTQAQAFTESLESLAPDLELPHFVWHYLSDADMRSKQPLYRDKQDATLSEIISAFEAGQIPLSKKSSTSLPAFLAAIAALVIAGYFLIKWLAP